MFPEISRVCAIVIVERNKKVIIKSFCENGLKRIRLILHKFTKQLILQQFFFKMKKLLIASTSTLHGSGYLDYMLEDLIVFFKSTENIVFLAYARPSGLTLTAYTEIVRKAFYKIGKKVIGLHEFENSEKALIKAKGIFVGGGNSFVLLNELYKLNLMQTLKSVIFSGTPYLGTSAGGNICGQSIGTSNDMPIVYPPSFEALGIIPFNINPHYIDPNPESKHMGETRATRIKEFHQYNAGVS